MESLIYQWMMALFQIQISSCTYTNTIKQCKIKRNSLLVDIILLLFILHLSIYIFLFAKSFPFVYLIFSSTRKDTYINIYNGPATHPPLIYIYYFEQKRRLIMIQSISNISSYIYLHKEFIV